MKIVKIVENAASRHQKIHGIERRYPSGGIPEIKKTVTYTPEEIEYLSKPMLYHVRRAKAQTK
jgi:hypothetical protein